MAPAPAAATRCLFVIEPIVCGVAVDREVAAGAAEQCLGGGRVAAVAVVVDDGHARQHHPHPPAMALVLVQDALPRLVGVHVAAATHDVLHLLIERRQLLRSAMKERAQRAARDGIPRACQRSFAAVQGNAVVPPRHGHVRMQAWTIVATIDDPRRSLRREHVLAILGR